MSYDDYGILYENNVLKSTTDKVTSFVLNPECTSIYGNSVEDYAFISCKDSLQSFQIEQTSNLETIQAYAFYLCTNLESADFTKCIRLNSIGSNAFYGCSSLGSITLPNSLKTLGEFALSRCAFSTINIPESVNTIGKGLFEYTKLTSVTFLGNSNITEIPDQTFKGTSITSITIPSLVGTIGGNAFESTNSLTNIDVAEGSDHYLSIDSVLYESATMILVLYPSAKKSDNFIMPDNVTAVASLSLSSSNIKNVTFSPIIERIASYSFQYSKLQYLYLPDSVTFIDTRAFCDCTSLSVVVLSKNITSLPYKCFSNTAITTITIPDSVTEIMNNCFENCKNLKSIVLPSSIEKLGGGIFAGCGKINITFGEDSQYKINEDYLITDLNELNASQYIGSNTSVTIPATITKLLSSCFSGKTELEKIIFSSENTLLSIDYQCFYGCTNLREIIIPTSVTTIGEMAFYNCISLTSLSFPASLQTISRYAFYNCSQLEEITFEGKTTSTRSSSSLIFNEYCFSECINLETALLPYGLETIGPNCFSNCHKLTSINFPETLINCSTAAFNSTGLVSISFLDSELSTISQQLFYNSSKLSEVQLSEEIISIGYEAFAYTALKNITIPSSVEKIGTRCFASCHSLTSFIVPSNLSELQEFGNYVFQDCISLKEFVCDSQYYVTDRGVLYSKDMSQLVFFPPASDLQFFSIPYKLKIISPSAFCQCNKLIQVLIPDDSVETISLGAFENCKNLVTINIPKYVTTVQNAAFSGCTKLSCGLVIENKTHEMITMLLNSGMPKRSIESCTHTGCYQITSFNANSLVFIFLTIAHKR